MAVMQATVTSGPCYFCKRPGHILRNCPDIKRGVQAPDRCSTSKKGKHPAWQCQARQDINRKYNQKKLQGEHAAPSREETSNGTPSARGKICEYPDPNALHFITSTIPSNDPSLLPPGTWCTLATSKPTTFLKDDGYDYISTGITGPSQHRQDFLVVGKERNSILGLLVLPCVMSVNCNEELLVLANACYPPLHIPPRTPIAIAIALPMGTMDQMPPRCFPVTPENPEVLWVQHISEQRPMLTCVPQEIKTDNGPSYTSQELAAVLNDWGVRHTFGIPYSPTSQGMIERTHQTLKRILDQQKGGEDQAAPQKRLNKALYVYNFLNSSAEEPDHPIYRHFLNNKKAKLKEHPPVLFKNLDSGQIEGPYNLITWGKGFACISTERGLQWIPAKNVKPYYASKPAETLTSASTSTSQEASTQT
ncbi:hypothetical protein DUI87_01152 [Hirundo rustica rustica]|uniref:Integrase n=1 Tax=Hirundo rustica rustica TaxID=333673 RepID=A0A3M0L4N0_HIRRU|nr:hypothetical protein DUI87_01152 [Hirundo rustica rustica]